MIRIAIVDDEPQARDRVKECLEFFDKKEGIEYCVKEFSSGRAFIGGYQPIYDIVLMDIQMPGEDGLQTARTLRKMDNSVIIMFVTNMAQMAIYGYEVEALDFIVKPVNKYDFAMKMSRALGRINRVDEVVQIKEEGETYSVPISSIKYLEVSGHYVLFHAKDRNYSEYTTLKNAESKIGKEFFVHCNRHLVVNLRYIDSIKRESVVVDGEELLFSRAQKKPFLSAYSDFLGGRR